VFISMTLCTISETHTQYTREHTHTHTHTCPHTGTYMHACKKMGHWQLCVLRVQQDVAIELTFTHMCV